MDEAEIVGWSHGRFGKFDGATTETLVQPVVRDALAHAGVDAAAVDAIFVGVMNNGFSKQDFQAALVGACCEELAHTPALRLENACATGTAALYAGLDFIAAGRGRVVLVVGAEAMTAVPVATAGDILLGASYRAEATDANGGFAGVFADITRSYSKRHGNCSGELAAIAAKNHANGVANPYAHMRRDLGFEFCNSVSEKNPFVAPPLRRTDCSPISDGAAAIVLASRDVAATLPRSIGFKARVHTNDPIRLSRRDPVDFAAARLAWQHALDHAGIDLFDLSLVETHDCFTIAELLEYEAMGLARPGRGADVVREGTAGKQGRLPVNPSGGLKAKGHPIGATGISMHIMAALQLMDEAAGMQVPNRGLAGVFNMGGVAVANYVSIMERRR